MTRAIPSLAAATVLLFVLAACIGSDDTLGDGTPPPGEFLIPVTLTEYAIDLPDDSPMGELTFEIRNDGEMTHSFAIEGGGVDERIEGEIAPGESQVLTVDLEPGTYTLWCPIGDHRDRGMEATIEVTEGSQSDAAPDPLGDDAVQPGDDAKDLSDDGS